MTSTDKKPKIQMEVDPKELEGNKCKMFEMGGKKGILCMERGKIVIYEVDANPTP